MAKKITDDDINDMVHKLADEIEKYTNDPIDRCDLNDQVSNILSSYGISFS